MTNATPIWRRLFMHWTRNECCRATLMAGRRIEISTAMMPMTTSNSSRLKPRTGRTRRMTCLFPYNVFPRIERTPIPMADLKTGDMAPDFELMNQDKNKVKLSDYRGKKKVMLLFYPMDFSPTCTQEHCTFAPAFDKLNGPDAETVIFGVSTDSPFCHAAFRKQYDIPYDLLADTSRKMVKEYGMFAGEEPYNCSKRGTVIVG